MLVLSWPLWVDFGDFPRIPFVPSQSPMPGAVSWVIFAATLSSLTLAMLGMVWRWTIGIGVAFLFCSILRDQGRFQPWVYQFLAIGLVLASASLPRTLRFARWYVIGLYFHSGLSKLDASFCAELGPTFLSTLLGPVGISVEAWPSVVRSIACLGLPAFEVAVALLLISTRTRRLGVVGAAAQHLGLIFILGPGNLSHSPIVLVWNVALLIQDVLIFWPVVPRHPEGEPDIGTRILLGCVLILPLGERFGLCDAWPAHALYASHAERSEIFVHEDEMDRFPGAILRHLGPSGATPWRRLDLTAWSREVRGTPPYPSGRIGNAVAEFLEKRTDGSQPIRLVQWGRASAWDGKRDRDESYGLRAIRLRGERFRFNARPE